jgi:hypothetical protein
LVNSTLEILEKHDPNWKLNTKEKKMNPIKTRKYGELIKWQEEKDF